jgi:hypothetical protein
MTGVEKPAEKGAFTSSDWEDLTEALLVSGREGDVEGFTSYVHPETIEMFEKSWAGLIEKAEIGLNSERTSPEDRKRLKQVVEGCSWESLARNYRPGRLITITPESGGVYRVKEILPAGRKVDYLVVKSGDKWLVKYEQDSRFFHQLEAVAHSLLNTILERNGIDVHLQPAGTPPAPPAGGETGVDTAGEGTPGGSSTPGGPEPVEGSPPPDSTLPSKKPAKKPAKSELENPFK